MLERKNKILSYPKKYFDFLSKTDLRSKPEVQHLLKQKYNISVGREYRRTLGQYVELHHIIPRFDGGVNTTLNYAVLRPSDHLIAHLILANSIGGAHWRAARASAEFINNPSRNEDIRFQILVKKNYKDILYNANNYKNKPVKLISIPIPEKRTSKQNLLLTLILIAWVCYQYLK